MPKEPVLSAAEALVPSSVEGEPLGDAKDFNGVGNFCQLHFLFNRKKIDAYLTIFLVYIDNLYLLC